MTKPDLMTELAAYKRLCSTPGIDASFKYQAAANFMNHAELEAAVRKAKQFDLMTSRLYDETGKAMHNSAREG